MLMYSPVSTMDRQKRQAWNSGISVRSQQIRLKKDAGIHLVYLQIEPKRAVAFKDAAAFRFV